MSNELIEVKKKRADEFQEAIINSTDSKIIVEAGAGSGKTYTLIERVRKLLEDGVRPENMVIITFTNMAAEELKERLVDIPGIGDCFVGTIHSFANKIFGNSNEEYKLFTEEIQDQFMSVLTALYGKHLNMENYLKYKDLRKKVDYGLISDEELKSQFTSGEIYEINVFLHSMPNKEYPENMKILCKKHNVITFDELLKRTTAYFKEIGGKIEYLFVDEYQDIGPLEKNFFEALNADNYFYVGDEKQCQPEGTLVTMSNGTFKKIEDLKIGDEVLSYNLKEGHYSALTRKGRGKKITAISNHYEYELIQIELENGLKSVYTKNHRCLARIHYEGNEDKSVVYIMQNEKGQFRVGSTKLFTFDKRNFGLRGRMNTEKAINGWILGVYENPYEAWLIEQTCAYKFGIPQLTWVYRNLSRGEIENREKNLDKLYSLLDDIEEKVKKCLEYFGRDINHPIFTKNTNKHFSKLHVTEVKACNLFPDIMDVAVPYKNDEGRYKNNYFQIKEVNCLKTKIPTKVYGLKIEDTETYVADGILTHNSIYGFKGGDVSYFLDLIHSDDWKTYYLNNNYRCSQKIIDIANEVILQADDIISTQAVCKSQKEGFVRVASKLNLVQYLLSIKEGENYKDWFILVRSNKDLYKVWQDLERLEIPNVTFKKGEITLEEMKSMMNENKVKLLTIHASKGLESPNVLLWGNFPIHQKTYLRNSDERKVLYVGITRAINKCIILN